MEEVMVSEALMVKVVRKREEEGKPAASKSVDRRL